MPKPFVPAHFWTRVAIAGPDECWEWQGYRNEGGYGRTQNGRRGDMQLTHRLAFTWARGPIPEGMVVCHSCDNPPCCNPAHLFLGTQADNVRDMRRKGRQNYSGPLNPPRKLTDAQVAAIRREYAAGGKTQAMIAARYGVHQVHVSRLVRRTRRGTVV